jgi:hypothetical protein
MPETLNATVMVHHERREASQRTSFRSWLTLKDLMMF